ncbi:hypothetical protein [Jiangella alba]|uniref:Uncharacterized protein n=1 Tax=Jiangella alba TaxID=561176 RepID=A0A1H5PIT3_9ACTN|nr:hypothetical protein [Jiangella alba]SEF13803.1 hypothetical protein SAMN04488561_4479 [Jiangella alba]
MARPLEVPFVANVRDFLRGTDSVSDALDDVVDSLDDISREAQRAGQEAGDGLSDGVDSGLDEIVQKAQQAGEDAGRRLSDGLTEGRPADELAREFDTSMRKIEADAESAAREVGASAEKMEASFREAFDAVRKDSSDAGRKVGNDVGDGFDRAKEGVGEFRDEANSTAREAAASFDGSAESVADAFQEVAANAFAGFGPAGAVAGLAAAAGIGFAIKAFQDGQEEAEEFRDRISEITGALYEIRSSGESPLTLVRDRLIEMAEAGTDADDNLAKIADIAREIEGINFEDLARGLAGDPKAAQRNIEFLDDYIQKLEDTRPYLNELNSDEYALHVAREGRAGRLRDMLVEEQNARGEANSGLAALLQAGIDGVNREIAVHEQRRDALTQYAEETRAAQEAAAQGYADSIQDAYNQAGSAIDQFTKDGIFNLDAYNTHLETSADAIRNYQTNIVEASAYLSDQALEYVRSLGPAAAPALQAFIDAPNDQKARTAANWNEQGLIASSSYEDALKAGIPDVIDGPRVRVGPVDDSSWVAWANRVSRNGITVPLRVQTFANQAV